MKEARHIHRTLSNSKTPHAGRTPYIKGIVYIIFIYIYTYWNLQAFSYKYTYMLYISCIKTNTHVAEY